MIPLKLELTNFISHKNSVIDFTEFSIALIVGEVEDNSIESNGAGKSTIIDALTWVLFEKSRASTDECYSSDVIREGAEQACVKLIFELKGAKYKVVREKSETKHTLSLFLLKGSEEIPLTGERIDITEEKIRKILNLDYNTFRSSALFEQGNIQFFTQKTSDKRREVLRTILNLAQYDMAYDKSKKVQAKYNKLIEQIEQNIETNNIDEKARVEADAIKELQKQIDKLEKQKKELDKTKQQHIDSKQKFANLMQDKEKELLLKEQIEQQIVAKETELENLKTEGSRQLKELKKQIDAIPTILDEIKKLNKKLVSLSNECKNLKEVEDKKLLLEKKETELDVTLKELKKDINNNAAELNNVKAVGAKCSTCLQIVDEKHKLNEIEKLNKTIEKAEKERNSLLDQIKENNESLIAIKEDLKGLKLKNEQIPTLKTSINELEVNLKLGNKLKVDFKTTKEKLNNQASNLKTDIENLKKQIAKQSSLSKKDIAKSILDEEKKIEAINTELKEINQKTNENTRLLGRAEQSLQTYCDMKFNSLLDTNILSSIENTKNIYSELTDIFGKHGIQRTMVEKCIEEVETEANYWLDLFSSGKMSLSIMSERKSKTRDTTTEAFDILVHMKNKNKAYSMFSGGEKLRIDFALRIALSTLLIKRAGATLDFLILDEVTSGLDKNGEKLFVDIINILTKFFKKIIIITHVLDLQSEFTYTLKVLKKGSISCVFREAV